MHQPIGDYRPIGVEKSYKITYIRRSLRHLLYI